VKRKLILLSPLAALAAASVYVAWHYLLPGNSFFLRELRRIDPSSLQKREGVISHLIEDFSTYDEFSEPLDPFEDTDGLASNGSILGTTEDNYGGERAVRVAAEKTETTVSRPIEKNLARWQNQGVLSMWIKLADATEVNRIDLRLRDADGKDVVLRGIENLHLPRERNQIKSDDDFPDHYFRGGRGLNKWEDYLLIAGWNYVFWEYADPLPVDMSRIRAHEAIVVRNTDRRQEMLFDNLRIQDGLLREKNPLNGNWYPPNGLPQFGVFDYEGKGRVRLLNVEWEQYPSNGDHVRILSREGSPSNFLLRVRFKVVKLAPRSASPYPRWLESWFQSGGTNTRYNTYVRLQWDFDNEYDPGHDWSGVFNSLEYEYLGLCRVFPIERYFEQGSEPDRHSREASVSFRLQNKREYEFDVKVTGQKAAAVVYEVYPSVLKRVARLDYTFRKQRPVKRYPISIETTGNIQAELHYIEVVSMD
jgi:hypothetical protein